ncbi:MAG: hypothetical protein ABIU05_09690, partial [Nitrospirales bacterium]
TRLVLETGFAQGKKSYQSQELLLNETGLRVSARNRRVYDAATLATCSGLPSAMICPPAAPPSGPGT